MKTVGFGKSRSNGLGNMHRDLGGRNVVYAPDKDLFFRSLPVGAKIKWTRDNETYYKVHNAERSCLVVKGSVSKVRFIISTEDLTCEAYETYLKMMDAYEDI